MALLDVGQKIELDEVLGEDTWELFEVIEDSFGIDLGDFRALCGISVAELVSEIRKRAIDPQKGNCLSAAAFYRVRRAFAATIELPEKEIHPSTRIAAHLPWWKRSRRCWQGIEGNLELKMPQLVAPRWTFFLALLVPIALMISLRIFLGGYLSALMIFAGSVLLMFPMLALLGHAVRGLPHDGETFGGLAKMVLARNYAALATQCGSSADDVLPALRQLVATATGVRVEQVSPQTRIPQDLDIY